jgi:hypothetical protein
LSIWNSHKKGWALKTPSLFNLLDYNILCLADPEHFGFTGRATTLISRFTILHGYGLGILHFLLCLTFHTISFHQFAS